METDRAVERFRAAEPSVCGKNGNMVRSRRFFTAPATWETKGACVWRKSPQSDKEA